MDNDIRSEEGWISRVKKAKRVEVRTSGFVDPGQIYIYDPVAAESNILPSILPIEEGLLVVICAPHDLDEIRRRVVGIRAPLV